MDLTKFLQARLDEDEAAVVAVENAEREPWQDDDWQDQHEADQAMARRFGPARVLREVEAKRKILADCDEWLISGSRDEPRRQLAARTIARLAAVWSDHPDFDPAWKET